MTTANYPRSFEPKAIWTLEEVCGYLGISRATYFDIEPKFRSFRVGRRRMAFAKDVIAYAETIQAAQNNY
jgi:hypothetical protein